MTITKDLKDNPCYKASFELGEDVTFFFGCAKEKKYSNALERNLTPDETIFKYKEDIDDKKDQSRYYNRVFYPEANKIDWSYKNNMAFWAGIIDSQKALYLVTPIEHYNFLGGTTQSEICWLMDNGYTIDLSSRNELWTKFVPPKKLFEENERILNNYGDPSNPQYSKKRKLSRLLKI